MKSEKCELCGLELVDDEKIACEICTEELNFE